VTARRDIRLLAESGLLRRTHGGAASLSAAAAREPSYLEKAGQASAEKAQIARAAAELIGDDDAVALGPAPPPWRWPGSWWTARTSPS
jgi:DeoR/GlpR family transcriptional regulator of sugar metabolism